MIYLDNAATTKVSQRVLDAMLPYLSEDYGNPGSLHIMGRRAAVAVQKAREQCAAPLGVAPDNILFTSGGSEANTLAILGLERYLKSIGKTHLITSQVEHPSVLAAMKAMEDRGFEVTYLPVGWQGRSLNSNIVRDAIREDTGLVSIMYVNNETGNMFPVQAISEVCKERGVLFHSDFVQAFGGAVVNARDIDFISVSGHKFHGPKGVGFLYASHPELLSPVIFGGEQEGGLRAGTENVASIVGMGEAAQAAYPGGVPIKCMGCKGERLYYALCDQFVNDGFAMYELNGSPWKNSKVLNLRFPGVDGATLLLLLDAQGVCVSAGSACKAYSAEPSHVLKAMGLTDDEARSSIRVSFSEDTTDDEIYEAAKIIANAVRQLKGT